MQEGFNAENVQKTGESKTSPVKPTIVKTDVGVENGQSKCPKCGATDISVNPSKGMLRCNFCRYEFSPDKFTALEEDLTKLNGQVIGSGAQDIVADTKDVVTFKCSSCGAEIVIDTSEATQARCHWCRNMLSVNEQIPNGSIPDAVLPFNVTKADARSEIEKFVKKRKFFANPKFTKEFTTENIMGVYFPYMVIDVNAHDKLMGQGEHLVRQYTTGTSDNQTTYYDANLFNVEREFDVTINGLTVESSSDKLNNEAKDKTNNIINAIMPFDIDNCVKWNANYLKGYTSEKRDTNVEELKELVNTQAKDVAKFSVNNTLTEYDRGVAWSTEQLDVKGQQWKAAYLPVWLYSYQEVKGSKKLLHYVAVNARTKETMGSVPIHMPKLILSSIFIEILAILMMLFVLDLDDLNWVYLTTGVIFFFVIYGKYRNKNARHKYETETKTGVSNLRKVDTFVMERKRMTNRYIDGANNTIVHGSTVNSKNFLDTFTSNNSVANLVAGKINIKIDKK